MLVAFETTTEIATCILHDFTTKIIRTLTVLDLSYNSTKSKRKKSQREKLFCLPKNNNKNNLRVYKLCWH